MEPRRRIISLRGQPPLRRDERLLTYAHPDYDDRIIKVVNPRLSNWPAAGSWHLFRAARTRARLARELRAISRPRAERAATTVVRPAAVRHGRDRSWPRPGRGAAGRRRWPSGAVAAQPGQEAGPDPRAPRRRRPFRRRDHRARPLLSASSASTISSTPPTGAAVRIRSSSTVSAAGRFCLLPSTARRLAARSGSARSSG